MRMIQLIPIMLFAVVMLGLAVVLVSPKEDHNTSQLIGQLLPRLILEPLEGYDNTALSDASIRGINQVSLLNLFASWCMPCLAEHPLFLKLKEQHGWPLYGVAWKDSPDSLTGWLTTNGNPYTALALDVDGQSAIALGATGVPETYIIDKQGRIAYRHAGPLTPSVLNDVIIPMMQQLEGE